MFTFLQVKKISSIFKKIPHTLFLVEEIDNAAIFPDDSGQFKSSQLNVGTTYEVHGESIDKPAAEASAHPSTPYGAYTAPVYYPLSKQPLSHTSKSKSLRRAVSLVSLSGIDPLKPGSSKAGKFDYTIVTQIYVCLTPDQCNVDSVADLVSKQVGFAVVLLDCKCYPLPSSSVTCGIDFWKGSRKILAASQSLYSQLNEGEVAEIPERKKQKRGEKLILKKLEILENRVSTPIEVRKALQCTICQGVASPPVVYTCCQRVVACGDCNRTWHSDNDRCPLCNTNPSATNFFELRGFDDVIRLICEQKGSDARSGERTDAPETDSSDEFEPMPTFRVPTN